MPASCGPGIHLKSPAPRPATPAILQDEVTDVRDDEAAITCAACGQRVTSPRSRTSVSGAHAHSFMNPHGLSFHIGCYREAPGVCPVGVWTNEHTWFSGYAWRVVLCTGCGAHLGWVYQREGADRFYGLIVGRLRQG